MAKNDTTSGQLDLLVRLTFDQMYSTGSGLSRLRVVLTWVQLA